MREFRLSFFVTFVCLVIAGYWGAQSALGLFGALWLVLVLGILEVSLSFDNAVVNAGVLKEMDEFWRKMFLTVGILIAVFGMRLVFPVVIVAVTTGLGPVPVMNMALERPEEYSKIITDAYPVIAAFGGMFLLLVFLNFIFDEEKERHWLGAPEAWLARLGRFDGISVLIALCAIFSTRWWLPQELHLSVLAAGVAGIILYIAVDGLGAFFENDETADAVTGQVKRAGFASFMYLEVLDASFSFDGVIGAFAITRDVVIIMLGLAIGAMFVRSMTVYLVNKGTLDAYVYLEHGAHYAIGVLAVIMLIGTVSHVPEIITGTIGVGFIALSVWSSVRYRKANPEAFAT
jgi:hypothetical protein